MIAGRSEGNFVLFWGTLLSLPGCCGVCCVVCLLLFVSLAFATELEIPLRVSRWALRPVRLTCTLYFSRIVGVFV